jgi:hypothetical protein
MSFYPHLTEPGVKYFLNETLKGCKKSKYEYYNQLFNITLFVMFFSILGGVLYYCAKSKKSDKELKEDNEKKQQYILNMVRKMQEQKEWNKKQNGTSTMITDLPKFESEFEITMKKFM